MNDPETLFAHSQAEIEATRQAFRDFLNDRTCEEVTSEPVADEDRVRTAQDVLWDL